jgi:hypothetical protein
MSQPDSSLTQQEPTLETMAQEQAIRKASVALAEAVYWRSAGCSVAFDVFRPALLDLWEAAKAEERERCARKLCGWCGAIGKQDTYIVEAPDTVDGTQFSHRLVMRDQDGRGSNQIQWVRCGAAAIRRGSS